MVHAAICSCISPIVLVKVFAVHVHVQRVYAQTLRLVPVELLPGSALLKLCSVAAPCCFPSSIYI
jgi:hypothetical protein